MWDVLERVRDLEMVLKGGTALAFTRGLNRHSTDLDFDTDRPVELSDRIEGAARALGVDLGPVERKDRRDHQRFLAPYPRLPGDKERFFKVNVRYKAPPKVEDIEDVDGIRTYQVPVLFDQELAAIASGIDARDLFDVAFGMRHYGDILRDDQIRRSDALTENLDRLERRYKKAFEADEVLRDIADVEDTVLRLRYATTDQRDLRWPHVQEQRIPIPTDVLGRVFAIQSRARMASRNETEPQSPSPGVDRAFLRSLWDADRKRNRARDADLDWTISR